MGLLAWSRMRETDWLSTAAHNARAYEDVPPRYRLVRGQLDGVMTLLPIWWIRMRAKPMPG